MSEIKTNLIIPAVGTSVALGDSGDTITIPSGVTFANNGTATGFSTGTVKYIGTSSLAFSTSALGASTTFTDGEATITIPAADVVGLTSIILVFIGNVRINRGTNHKVQKNSSVMTDAGVIGHVIHSSSNSSKVLLITDSRSAVDSLFQETRESGITVGTGENICEMKFVPISAKVNLGDKVLSSGLGGVFPKGLVVGTVVDIVKKSQELFQDIMVAPSADLSNIEEVIVLLSNQVKG